MNYSDKRLFKQKQFEMGYENLHHTIKRFQVSRKTPNFIFNYFTFKT